MIRVKEKDVSSATLSLKNSELNNIELVLIEEHVRHILVFMGFESVVIKCSVSNSDVLQINIEAGEGGNLLIGNKGSHLNSLQHVVRCVLKRHMSQNILIAVDVNSYRARREVSLLGLAENIARKARRTGLRVEMDPMSAADRRAVHAALANRKDIETESLGEDPNRRVVVKPIFL